MKETAHPEYFICPACGEHGDAWEWREGGLPGRAVCHECGQLFDRCAEFGFRWRALVETQHKEPS